jgi:hypothetical protein
MALFKRADLKAQGLTDEQIEFVMTEGNSSLAKNYTLNSDVQAQIEAAAQNAPQQPADVKTTPEYVELARERDMLRAIGGEDFAGVKPKFRETVFGMLDRGEKRRRFRISSRPSARNTKSISSRRKTERARPTRRKTPRSIRSRPAVTG